MGLRVAEGSLGLIPSGALHCRSDGSASFSDLAKARADSQHCPCHFHVHDVHEVHSYFDSIPLSPFFAVEEGFEAVDFLHSSQPLPKPSAWNWVS